MAFHGEVAQDEVFQNYRISLNFGPSAMKVIPLELAHRGGSNEYNHD